MDTTASIRRKSFMKRHGRLLGFVGALIVFVTFILKEGLREHWKDLADALNSAQYVYSIRIDTSASNSTLHYMRKQIDDLRALVLSNGKLPSLQSLPAGEIIMENMGRLEMLVDTVEASLANIEVLVDKLPQQDTNRERLHTLNKELVEVRKGSSNVVGLVTPTDLPKDPKKAKAAFNLLLDRAAQEESVVGDRAETLDSDAKKLVSDVLEDAKPTRDRNSRYSDDAWWISATLYSIGWGLGLIARLFHVEVLERKDSQSARSGVPIRMRRPTGAR